jgi:hypothetical protein
MSATAEPRRNREEVARLGQEIFERRVKPNLKPEDDGKYVAIDIATEEYEIDHNEWDAIARLRNRQRPAHIWLTRIGKPVQLSYRLRFAQ